MTTTAQRPARDYGDRVTEWERKTAIPMLALAALSIAILVAEYFVESTQTLADSDLPSVLEIGDLVIMVIFAIEFGYRIWMVPQGLRIRYVLANPIDVLVVLVLGAQPLRLLRSARALRAFRAVRVAAMMGKGSKQSIAAVTRDRLVHGATIVIIATAVGAYAFAYFEGGTTNRFSDLPDAFWWSAATISTLGPGIELDQTGSRVVALFLTVIGLSIVAALAGAISAFFVESDTPDGSVT
jgi:voltage-gated potassium channel